jgi:glutaredoxin
VNRLTLITRAGCHLCEVAEQVLDKIGESWERVDVDDSLELIRDYGDRVPVVLLDGVEHDYWRVDEDRLRRDIAKPPGAPRW